MTQGQPENYQLFAGSKAKLEPKGVKVTWAHKKLWKRNTRNGGGCWMLPQIGGMISLQAFSMQTF